MLVSVNEARTTITVKSDVLSDFSSITTAALEVSLNCTLVDTVTILEGDVTVDSFSLTAALLDRTVFEQGIWGFVLVITNTDESVTNEYRCLLVEDTLVCSVAAYTNGTDTEAERLQAGVDYVILQNASTCSSNCADFCTIYERLTDVLLESSC